MKTKSKKILGIDLGGTNLRIGLFEVKNSKLELKETKYYLIKDLGSLDQALDDFVKQYSLVNIVAAGLGVAGAVIDDCVHVNNVGWDISAKSLELKYKFEFYLINDIEACAFAVQDLADEDIIQLNPNSKSNFNANRSVITLGTGLGAAIILKANDSVTRICATEYGATTFSPNSKRDISLVNFLHKTHTHISKEDVVSGMYGFRNLLDFYLTSKCSTLVSNIKWSEIINSDTDIDIGRIVTVAAKDGDEFAKLVLEHIVELFANCAADLVLSSMALGGVYIGGGIPLKIIDSFKSDYFLKSFFAKGKYKEFMKQVPINLIADADISIKGAAAYACSKR